MSQLYLILKQDLKLAWWNKGFFFHTLSVFLVINLILNFVLQEPSLSNIGILTALVFSSALSGVYLIKDDFNNFHLQQLILSGTPAVIISAAKIISNFIMLLACAFVGILIELLIATPKSLVILLLVYGNITFILALLSIFASLLTVKIKHSEIANLIIIFPIVLSFLLYSVAILSSEMQLNNQYTELKILLGISLVSAPLILLGCGNCLSRI